MNLECEREGTLRKNTNKPISLPPAKSWAGGEGSGDLSPRYQKHFNVQKMVLSMPEQLHMGRKNTWRNLFMICQRHKLKKIKIV